MKADREPFSFAELNAEPRLGIIEPSRLTASDGCEIAYYDYRTEGAPARALVFVHGGGACSCLGYQYLAATLSA